ncbi:MAG: ABC transporter substrate-binding protein [Gemmatimonadales bacterium]
MIRKLALGAALLAMGALACRGEQPAEQVSVEGGTLVIAAPGDADLLLPGLARTQLASHVIERIFPKLAEMKLDLVTDDDSGFVPAVARSWERRDPTTIVFHLDPRARWSDGRRITASDVVYTFGVYNDPATNSPDRVNVLSIADVVREDSLTVIFRFRRSYPEQLYDATYQMKLLPSHLLDSIPHARLASSAFTHHPVGAGPFRFLAWDPGAQITLIADTTWFLGRPHLARIVWRVMPDVSAAVTALLAGEADAMEVIPQRDEIERAKKSADLTLVPYPSPFLAGLLFNSAKPMFADRDIRRALAMAVDRATIVQAVFGPYGEVPVGAVSPMMWVAHGEVRQLPFDTAAAARLLDGKGWRMGADHVRHRGGQALAFTVITPTTSRARQEVAVLLQDQLKRMGVAVTIQPLEISEFTRREHAGEFDAEMFSRTLDPSPSNLVQFWGHVAGNDNVSGYRSAGFDSLYAAAMAAPSHAEALPRWRRVLEQLNDDAPAVFLFSPKNQAAIHRRFDHVSIRPDSWLATVATWSVAPDKRLPRDR